MKGQGAGHGQCYRDHATAAGIEIRLDNPDARQGRWDRMPATQDAVVGTQAGRAAARRDCECPIDTSVDRASGVEICHTMLGMRGGDAWALPTANKQDADASAASIREFLGLSR